MTHSSGITASTELKNVINQARFGQIRLIKMSISAETISLDTVLKPVGSWQQDFNSSILPCLKADQPCYILYKMDSRFNDGNSEWLLITYVPEATPTRQKMIYASTKMAMKNTISCLHVKHEYAATTANECSLEGFTQYKQSLSAPKPLTRAEKELEIIKKNEEEMRHQGKRQTLQSVSFPLSSELEDSLLLFRSAEINYVQMCLDITKEVINLSMADNIHVDKLKEIIPKDKTRYHLFSFIPHNSSTPLTVFIYSIPPIKSSIKEKMLYSTCKLPLLQCIENKLNISIAKKIESDSPEEITEEFLNDQLSSSSVGNNVKPVRDIQFKHQNMFQNLNSAAYLN